MCGDVNEWLPVGRPLRWLGAAFGRSPPLRTFPSRLPLLALDRVWVSPRELSWTARAHASATARVASDHLPYVAEIRLPDLGRRGSRC